MRKIAGLFVWVTGMLCVTVTAGAQLHLGLKGGLNISSVTLSSDIIKPYNVTGFHIGPLVEVMTPLGIGFDGAILYSQKGLEIVNESVQTDYIEVPVNLKWKIGPPLISYLIKAYLAAGPYAEFRVGDAKTVWNSVASQIETKSFAGGVNLGVGVELFSRLQAGFNYGIGLTDNYNIDKISNVTDIKAKSKTMSITAVLLF